MIYTDGTKLFFTASRRADSASMSLKNGDIVNAKILSLKTDGAARIFFNGHIFEGNVSGALKEGDSLKMRVLIEGERIFLLPEKGSETSSSKDIFSKLGLPQNELISNIIAFFTATETRLDEKSINRIFNFLQKKAAKSSLKEKERGAFAASLIESKGLELSDELFSQIYAAIFGGGRDKNDDEVLEMINHLKGEGLHWIILPFEREFDSSKAAGSLALLLDIGLKELKSLVLRCNFKKESSDEGESWIFSLQDKEFSFMSENAELSQKEKADLEKLFTSCLTETGFFDSETASVFVRYGEPSKCEPPLSVDLRV
ncbi:MULTISPECIES: hypothetical protein [unclassified Treponema]|uniref:hypothetical protein n=1 Tax=unclassified Treponema TaxID=2638727 RepID=UPI0020A5364D|nr:MULTISPECIES: hypothetical protein [unclassified Treponema]UTC66320.1 hypothetical protein E4O06_10090 [Treponema sp. OMZ 789]UTC69050.1 hypothetical protein E4O01_10240 [Treponema sp. OMZ 790]UTC71762.1 hypothetical protein E4O02_10330 [Treponema sp. OMZ 791]